MYAVGTKVNVIDVMRRRGDCCEASVDMSSTKGNAVFPQGCAGVKMQVEGHYCHVGDQ